MTTAKPFWWLDISGVKMTDRSALITLIRQAWHLGKIAIWLGWAAVAVFVMFGTLASLRAFANHTLIYALFYYLPYGLVGLSIPISLYQSFLIWRYRLMQTGILLIILVLSMALSLLALATNLSHHRSEMALGFMFMALCSWFALPYLFQISLKRFLTFLTQSSHLSD